MRKWLAKTNLIADLRRRKVMFFTATAKSIWNNQRKEWRKLCFLKLVI